MTRRSKIARLPLEIRNELNRRLQDGESGPNLLEWLNRHQAVQKIIKEEFDGRPITEQNLSDWRIGGYQDWLRFEESRDYVQNLAEQSEAVDDTVDRQEICDRYSYLLAVQMTRHAQSLLDQESDPDKRWQRMADISRVLSRMRRDDHRELRLLIKRQQWDRQTEREEVEDEKRRDKEYQKELWKPLWANLEVEGMAPMFGGGDKGWDLAAAIVENKHKMLPGELGRRLKTSQPQTLDAKRQTPNPNPKTPDARRQTRNPAPTSDLQSPNPQTPDARTETPNPVSQCPEPKNPG